MAKMGKLTPEEEARNKMIARERDRERKRMKRMNPEYRRMEQERDRDRKKARRSNEAFRQLEKLRDKIRKERKKGMIVDEAALRVEFLRGPTDPVEPEIIISDNLTAQEQHELTVAHLAQQHNQQQHQDEEQHMQNRRRNLINSTNTQLHNLGNSSQVNNANHSTANSTAATGLGEAGGTSTSATTMPAAHALSASSLGAQMSGQLNKGLPLYPPPAFSHHHLPLAGVTLMPQLCHPILHQNLSAALYPPNGIKQEYGVGNGLIKQEYDATALDTTNAAHMHSSIANGGGSNSSANGNSVNDDNEPPLIEPEIILSTSNDVIAAPHHFHNHAAAAAAAAATLHTHHLHPQQCGRLFTHMTQQAHMSTHMRAHAPPALAHNPGVPLPLTTTHLQQQQQHQQQHQQQQIQQPQQRTQ